jgi:hypothetical protein
MTYAYNAQLGGRSAAAPPTVLVQIAIELDTPSAFLRDAPRFVISYANRIAICTLTGPGQL